MDYEYSSDTGYRIRRYLGYLLEYSIKLCIYISAIEAYGHGRDEEFGR
jgi:hypothetical protein